ncbi:hypothetical protein VTP01DRAFT_3891 [Rhizomucor pusillus]|uniref:uncharacterized protein n=1 Tax=Rhizomucor pusillus TaxID=4840 RepID=UPI003743E83E
MLDQDDIEEAIARIQDLGISRSKAVKALSRYNYDVSRAADYIFSGNALDSESESELERQDTPNSEENKEQRDGPNFQTADTKNEASSVNSARGSFNFGRELMSSVWLYNLLMHAEDNASSSRNTYSRSTSDLNEALKYDPAQWSVVPFSSNDRNLGWDTPVMPSSTSYAEPSVTWWIDPEDPADRSAQNDMYVYFILTSPKKCQLTLFEDQ